MKNRREQGEKGETSTVTAANKDKSSVRTTIPTGVASHIPIIAGSRLSWILDKDKNGWFVTVRLKK